MPRVAILSDIHANIRAFKAVLREIQGDNIQQLAILGDTVGYGADPEQCVRLAMAISNFSIMGNHDLWATVLKKNGTASSRITSDKSEIITGLLHASNTLSLKQWEWIGSLPYFCAIDGGVLVHASLDQPANWNYIDTPESATASINILRGQERHIAFCGHTHRQLIFSDSQSTLQVEKVAERTFQIPMGLATVIGVGSVGQPREMDGDEAARWAIWDSSARTIQFCRTS